MRFFEDDFDTDGYTDPEDIDPVEFMNIELAETALNHKLLSESIGIARANILWYFMSIDSKLKRVKLIHNKLKELIKEELEKE